MRGCITNEYMAASAVVTVRIEPALLSALKQKAEREGRSVSAELVRLVRDDVMPHADPGATPLRAERRKTSGMFADFEAPDLDELREARRDASKRLARKSSARRSSRAPT